MQLQPRPELSAISHAERRHFFPYRFPQGRRASRGLSDGEQVRDRRQRWQEPTLPRQAVASLIGVIGPLREGSYQEESRLSSPSIREKRTGIHQYNLQLPRGRFQPTVALSSENVSRLSKHGSLSRFPALSHVRAEDSRRCCRQSQAV